MKKIGSTVKCFTVLLCILMLFSINTLNAGVVGDINNDGKIGLAESIHSLQVTAGLKPAPKSSYSWVTVGLIGSGAAYECDGTDDLNRIQTAIDTVESSGGGVVHILAGEYTLKGTLVWDKTNVKVVGDGMDNTIINCINNEDKTEGNCINLINKSINAPIDMPPPMPMIDVFNSKVWLEDLTLNADSWIEQQGIGIFVDGDITVDIELHRIRITSIRNAIYYHCGNSGNFEPEEDADTDLESEIVSDNPGIDEPSEWPFGNLGNIVITDCEFPKSCISTNGNTYYHSYHKISIWGNKPKDTYLNISHNKFKMYADQPRPQRTRVVELRVSGCSGAKCGEYDLDEGPSIDGGIIAYNDFDGSSRECLLVYRHRNLIIAHNKMNDVGIGDPNANAHAIGLYALRGYRSIVSHNIVQPLRSDYGSKMRGIRIDKNIESVWVYNQTYHVGFNDHFHRDQSDVSGMTINGSKNNIIVGNIIKADDNDAILIIDYEDQYSEGNFIARNELQGNHTDLDIRNMNNIFIQHPNNVSKDNTGALIGSNTLVLHSFANSHENLELYFPFLEDSGNFRDYSKNGASGEVIGILNRIDGYFGKAVQFDGDPTNYIQIDQNIGSYDATYYIVFRLNDFDINTPLPFLVRTNYASDSSGRYYMVNLTKEDEARTNITVRYHNGIASIEQNFYAGISSTTELTKLAITFKQNNNGIDVSVYVNGQLKSSATMEGFPSLSSNITNIGGNENSTINGDIHLFKAWSKALTAEEVRQETFVSDTNSVYGLHFPNSQ